MLVPYNRDLERCDSQAGIVCKSVLNRNIRYNQKKFTTLKSIFADLFNSFTTEAEHRNRISIHPLQQKPVS